MLFCPVIHLTPVKFSDSNLAKTLYVVKRSAVTLSHMAWDYISKVF